MSNKDEEVEITSYLKCSHCGNGQLVVGLSTKNELMLGCTHCGGIVALIDQWPHKEMLEAAVCNCENCITKRKETFN